MGLEFSFQLVESEHEVCMDSRQDESFGFGRDGIRASFRPGTKPNPSGRESRGQAEPYLLACCIARI